MKGTPTDPPCLGKIVAEYDIHCSTICRYTNICTQIALRGREKENAPDSKPSN